VYRETGKKKKNRGEVVEQGKEQTNLRGGRLKGMLSRHSRTNVITTATSATTQGGKPAEVTIRIGSDQNNHQATLTAAKIPFHCLFCPL